MNSTVHSDGDGVGVLSAVCVIFVKNCVFEFVRFRWQSVSVYVKTTRGYYVPLRQWNRLS